MSDAPKRRSSDIPHPSLWRYPSVYIEADEERSTRSFSSSEMMVKRQTKAGGKNNDNDDKSTTTKCKQSSSGDGKNENNDDDETMTTTTTTNESLPIGVPVEFESDLFSGKILFRFRSELQSDDPETDKKYFEGRKRLVQTIVQGRFKEVISMNDLYIGDYYEKPLTGLPPTVILRTITMIFKSLIPGVIFDIASKNPKVVTLYGGSVQVLRVDRPGEEPDIHNINIQEETSKLGFKSIAERKRILRNPKKAKKYVYDTEHVYTFDNYDDIMDTADYYCNLSRMGKFDMTKVLNGQPMSIGAVTTDGRWVFRFRTHSARHTTMLMDGAGAQQSNEEGQDE